MECTICKKVFPSNWRLKRHTDFVHAPSALKSKIVKTPKTSYECDVCKKIMATRFSLSRHIKVYHRSEGKPVKSKNSHFTCLDDKCNKKSFPNTTDFEHHLRTEHNIAFHIEVHTFTSKDEFWAWKLNLERDENLKYIAYPRKPNFWYFCYRSYHSAVPADPQIRQRKTPLKQLPYKCTSRMKVSVKEDGAYQVEYTKNHYGHDVQAEIPMVPLSELDKREIAARLINGETPLQIVQDIQRNISGAPKRIHFIKRSDVANIRNSLRNCLPKLPQKAEKRNKALKTDSWPVSPQFLAEEIYPPPVSSPQHTSPDNEPPYIPDFIPIETKPTRWVEIVEISSNHCYNGEQMIFSHNSSELQCSMNFSVFLPDGFKLRKLPVIYWLSGLTCNEQTFSQKSGFQRSASKKDVIVVCPDTSPRGLGVPDSSEFNIGSSAGFYVDATEEPYQKNYRMYSYVTLELPALIEKNFNILPGKRSIMGHGMGGHGALICALKNPGMYQSVSVFAAISNPSESDWGKKAFSAYLGSDISKWAAYDATYLVQDYQGPLLSILFDQGLRDQFLKLKQLLPENFLRVCVGNDNIRIVAQIRDNFDHSYYFVSTFIAEHIAFHVEHLVD